MDVETKYALLKENIKNYGKIAVAYSGGLDSTFLLKVCHDVLGDNVIAVSIRTDLQPVREYLGSEEFVKKEGIKHFILEFNDYTLPCFKNNPPDRCYYCKKEILSRIINVAANEGITTIVDGSNMDDLCDYRPGRRALTELHIKSPLLEAGMTKKDSGRNLPWSKAYRGSGKCCESDECGGYLSFGGGASYGCGTFDRRMQ